MSIFSGEAVPSRVVGVLRTLHGAPDRALPLAHLQVLMHPRSVWSKHEQENGQPNPMVEENLEVCVDLGLVDRPAEKDGAYRLRDDANLGGLSYEDCIKELGRRILGGKGTAEKDGVNLYDQLSWMLAWYLEQSPDRWPATADGMKPLVGEWEDLGFKTIHQTPHFDQFRHWGEALGILSFLELKGPNEKVGTAVLLANPAPFLRRHLADFMQAGTAMDVESWFKELAERFRIFETGPIRLRVGDRKDRAVSPALELALRQLQDEGLLKLAGVTDGKEYWLKLEGQKPVSHLTYLPEKAA